MPAGKTVTLRQIMSVLNDELTEFITTALMQTPQSVMPINGGANNQTYRITLENGEYYALKSYHVHDFERDLLRMHREYSSFSFLHACGEQQIPKALACDQKKLLAIYTWVPGSPFTCITDSDIRSVVSFVSRLKQYSQLKSAKKILPASDNVLCVDNIFTQIQRRLDFLEKEMAHNPTLHAFLNKKYKPAYHKMREKFRNKSHLLWGPLSLDQAILSPSDFGFHNMLKNDDNSVFFIDFEYFGWEDPAALLAHFLLHPGMTLSESNKILLHRELSLLFIEDKFFQMRYHVLYFLLGFVWTLILLNEFLPFIQKRRLSAGQFNITEIEKMQITQLQKAQKQLDRLMQMDQLNYREILDQEVHLC